MNIPTLIIATTLFSVASAPALAGNRYDNGYFDRARVVTVQPLIKIVRVPSRHRECWTEEAQGVRPRDTSGSMVLGSIIGGVIGHQFGGGDGRRVATVAGTLIGAAVGRNMALQQSAQPYTVTARRCRVSHEFYEKQRVDGYRVTYRYRGRTFITRTPQAPGKFIRVRVSVAPAWQGHWRANDYQGDYRGRDGGR